MGYQLLIFPVATSLHPPLFSLNAKLDFSTKCVVHCGGDVEAGWDDGCDICQVGGYKCLIL